jgi:hypothetical protein
MCRGFFVVLDQSKGLIPSNFYCTSRLLFFFWFFLGQLDLCMCVQFKLGMC